MRKSEFLAHWSNLKAGMNFIKHFRPVPAKATGSKYGACGIRIEGNPDFVDGVLSRLKDVLAAENENVRLNASYSTVDGDGLKSFNNKDDEAVVVYIRLQNRK